LASVLPNISEAETIQSLAGTYNQFLHLNLSELGSCWRISWLRKAFLEATIQCSQTNRIKLG